MKKLFLYILILAFLLCGCAAPEQPEVFSEPTPAPTTAIPEETQEPAEPTPAPTPEPDALDAADGIYTIGWISDTQHYSAKFPEIYVKMTEFLAAEQQRMNLGYIVHTGDLVHNFDDPAQWEIANAAQRTIDHIPNGVLAGNHDFNNDTRDISEYSALFGQVRYEDKEWYGGSFEDNRCHYDLITLGKTDYLFVYVSYLPDSNSIKWANEIFAQHPDRVGILCVHDYYKTDTTLSEDGSELYKKIVKKNPNLYMVLCGHRYTVFHDTAELDDNGDDTTDRTVHQAMANYQSAGEEGGSGYMRFMQVDEAAGKIRMYTYSPVYDDYNYFDTPEHLAEKYPSEVKYEEYEIDIPWQLN